MKITVSYKQTGVSNKELDDKLGKIREIIDNIGHTSFIYYLDDTSYKYQTAKEIINKTKNEIETSDMMVVFINYSGISEGMMQELGIAYALNKRILILINKKLENEYSLTYGISNNTVFFNNFSEVETLLQYNLPISG